MNLTEAEIRIAIHAIAQDLANCVHCPGSDYEATPSRIKNALDRIEVFNTELKKLTGL